MTMDEAVPKDQASGEWDLLIEQLQTLRKTAGNPSFGRIAELIVERRVQAGASPAAAHLARSTVYDTFRVGRPRVNLHLVREAAIVLGADDATVDTWIALCRRGDSESEGLPDSDVEIDTRRREVVLLMTACLVLNLVGREFVDFFNLPIYLDMIGTAIAAIALGPWRGAAVGASTNVVGIVGSGWLSLPFGLVNVAGALMWGYGVRRWGMGRTLPRFFILNVLTAIVCTLVAVPIIVTFLGQDLRVGHDVITQLVEESVDTFLVAVGFSNAMTSMGDKLISGFVALVAVTALPWHMRRGIPLVMADHKQ